MCRDFDTINPRTHPFIILPSPETEVGAYPFWYACVLGIFHADVQHTGLNRDNGRDFHFKKLEFLWVRWLGVVPDYACGRKQAKLPKIGFVPDSDEFAFGFLDPSLVIRGCHLIPAFADSRTSALLQTRGPTEARQMLGIDDDWASYYVGMYTFFLSICSGSTHSPNF